MASDQPVMLTVLLWGLLEIPAIVAAIDAVMRGRTAEGAIAWAISLIFFPPVALPFYLVFGNRKFAGHVSARRVGDLEINHIARDLSRRLLAGDAASDTKALHDRLLERLAKMPLTEGNRVRMLIDGPLAFRKLFKAVVGAEHYVLVQYYIIRDDDLGREFRTLLEEKSRHGVRVYLLYDEIGCHDTPDEFWESLQRSGVTVSGFPSNRNRVNRFQLNFRNHRKIVVVDGRSAFVGGMNVGSEYLGHDTRYGAWRDTQVCIEGPSVQCVQLTFLEDWYSATRHVPGLEWTPEKIDGENHRVYVLPTGPADDLETCNLFFVYAIHQAKERLWISSPYFVPDQRVIAALQLAGLRGVDVRIMLPQKADLKLVQLASLYYVREAGKTGVKFYRYQPGFLHQKVMLIDDRLAAVGTANLDNRSFRINFEITLLFEGRGMAAEMETMLRNDFNRCSRMDPAALDRRSFLYRMAVHVTRLMAPVA